VSLRIEPVTAAAIAQRIQMLLGDHSAESLASAAVRLGVSERSLRWSIDPITPHQSVALLLAVVHEYGVDPAWLLTGDYDSATHRSTADADRRTIAEILRRTALRTPPHSAPPMHLVLDDDEQVTGEHHT